MASKWEKAEPRPWRRNSIQRRGRTLITSYEHVALVYVCDTLREPYQDVPSIGPSVERVPLTKVQRAMLDGDFDLVILGSYTDDEITALDGIAE